jgi:KUP system potassium uptake protein
VILATVATIIASQAVITGAFSLTRQAIQLGILPRMEVRHTSEHTSGQIYMPRVNWILLVVVLGLVWSFRSSSGLANAYGISVFGAMTVDAILAFIVIWKGWRWSLAATCCVILPFLAIDVAFFSANMLKLFHGGFVPVMLAAVLVILMATWIRGSGILFEKTRKADVPLLELLDMLAKSPPHRVKGTAVFLTGDPVVAPAAMLHNLKHNKVLHEKNAILTVRSLDVPRIAEDERVRIEPISDGFWKMELRYGYMESPNIPKGLGILRKQGFKFDIMSTSFLPVAPLDQAIGQFRHAALAGQAVHLDGTQRHRCHQLLPDPDRTRGRGRHAGDRLIAAAAAPLSWPARRQSARPRAGCPLPARSASGR